MADAPVDSYNTTYTPELNAAVLEQLKKKIALQKEQDIAAAQGAASARGIAGSSFEGTQIARANQTATDAETNAAVQLAIQNATAAREERLIKQGQEFQTSERLGSQTYGTSERVGSEAFAAKQNQLQQQYQSLEAEKQRAFAAGENEKARSFQAQQDELMRQFQANQATTQRAYESGQNAKQRKVDIISGLAGAGGQGIGTAVGLCFVGDTLIEMMDGSKKMIKDILLGDMTKAGVALSWRQAISNHVYNYKGVFVSAAHAVKTSEGWKRVMQIAEAKHVPGIFTVYNLVTPTHRMFIEGMEFTDEFEYDDPYCPLEQSLARLNADELAKVGK